MDMRNTGFEIVVAAAGMGIVQGKARTHSWEDIVMEVVQMVAAVGRSYDFRSCWGLVTRRSIRILLGSLRAEVA